MDFAVPGNQWVKIKENEKRDRYLNLARELKTKKKAMEQEGYGDTNCNWRTWNNPQRGLKELKIGGRAEIHPNYSIVEVGQGTWGDLLLPRLQWKTIS